jgi:hypothetical protein
MEHGLNPSSFPPGMPAPRKAGHGCVVQVLAALVFGVAVLMGIMAVFTPWGFYMGGRFHIIPQWTGWGRMHSNIAGDYAVLMTFSPKTGRHMGLTHVTGNAWICTPRGEKFNLRLGGDFQNPHGIDLQGKTAHIYASYYSTFNGSTAPSLDFRGKWNNPDLVLDDGGSLNRAFDPGGALVTNHHMRPYKQEVVPLTLHEGGKSEFNAACAALKSK